MPSSARRTWHRSPSVYSDRVFRSATVVGVLALFAVGCSNSSDDAASTAATGAGRGSQASSGAGANQGQTSSTGSGASGGGGSANADCELLFSSGFEQDLDQWQLRREHLLGRTGRCRRDASQRGHSCTATAASPCAPVTTPTRVGSPAQRTTNRTAPTPGSPSGRTRTQPRSSTPSGSIKTPTKETGWVHFGTWGNCVQNGGNCGTGTWALHTMSVLNDLLEFAHTEPHGGNYLGAEPRTNFPYGQWTRFSVYIDYGATTGTVQVWQDGEPMLEADVVNIRRQRRHAGVGVRALGRLRRRDGIERHAVQRRHQDLAARSTPHRFRDRAPLRSESLISQTRACMAPCVVAWIGLVLVGVATSTIRRSMRHRPSKISMVTDGAASPRPAAMPQARLKEATAPTTTRRSTPVR